MECKYANAVDCSEYGVVDYCQDWFCRHPTFQPPRTIECYVDIDDATPLIPPNFCPLKVAMAKNTNKGTVKMKRTYAENNARLKEAWGPNKWDNIQAGEIYHLPPVLGQQRADLLILSKTDYALRVKEVTPHNCSAGIVRSIFKSDGVHKFLVPNKLIKFEKPSTALTY